MAKAGFNRDAVVAEAARLADEVGLERLTLAALAGRSGVRQPSLYKHIESLTALHRAIALRALGELTDVLTRAAVGKSRHEAIRALARPYREWAKTHPGWYQALQRAPEPGDAEHEAAGTQVVGLFGDVLAGFDLHGDKAVDAIRGLRSARPTGPADLTAGVAVSVVSVVAFLAEVAILVVLAVAGVRLGADLAVRICLGIALPAAVVVVWGRWMAPRSAGRLADPARFVAQVALSAVTAAVASFAGIPVWGAAVAPPPRSRSPSPARREIRRKPASRHYRSNMEPSITRRDLVKNTDAVLEAVQAGQSYVVTNRGEPVARLVPITDSQHPPHQPATKHGGFGSLPRHRVSPPTRDTLNDLRGDQ